MFEQKSRVVRVLGDQTNHPHHLVKGNDICTSKYTRFTFVPKNLLEQFRKMANIYFLFISFMQMIPIISITNGFPAQIYPLGFVVALSMLKDLFEDYKKHKSDHEENMKETIIFNKVTKKFEKGHWQDVKVGDIVKVMCDQFFPADMVLCKSSESKGLCYVETKNLDGETNLKHKVVEKYINKKVKNLERLHERLDGTVICEIPNDQIYKFEGSYLMNRYKARVSLNSEHVLLRGQSLRNTEWIVGFVVYSGHQTKVMMNSANSKYKMSTIEKGTNKQIILIFLVQLLMCLGSAIVGTVWQDNTKVDYLDLTEEHSLTWDRVPFLMILK